MACLDLVPTKVKQKLSSSHLNKYMYLGIIGLHQKEIGTLVNISILDTKNNTIGKALFARVEVDMSQDYVVIGCIPQFCLDVQEFYKFKK